MGFTRNYYLLKMFSSGVPYWDNEKSVSNEWRLKNTEGKYQTSQITTERYGGYTPFASPLGTTGSTYQSGITSIHGACYPTIGTDDTPENIDDYKLTIPATLPYSDASVEYTLSADGTEFNVTMYRTFLNCTTEPVEIKELGVHQVIAGASYLIYRKVLDAPVTVPANGYYKASVSYTVPVPSEIVPSAVTE